MVVCPVWEYKCGEKAVLGSISSFSWQGGLTLFTRRPWVSLDPEK